MNLVPGIIKLQNECKYIKNWPEAQIYGGLKVQNTDMDVLLVHNSLQFV